MFQDREDAAMQLARVLKVRPLRRPLVLAIPRGGVVTGAVLARELGADLDVVLARKLRAPEFPEVAIGAVAEDGRVVLNRHGFALGDEWDDYLARETAHQRAEISRRQQLFRGGRPPLPVAGRSVIVADDGIATGSTMIAALHALRTQQPYELIVAVPVGTPDALDVLHDLCDDVTCLLVPDDFHAVGQYYADFRQVEDDEAVALLESAGTAHVG